MSFNVQTLRSNEQYFGTVAASPGRCFTIPYNQRPWEWTKKHFLELWSNILETRDRLYERNNDVWSQRQSPLGFPHFIGAFVFVRDAQNANNYLVVDGQQRLTTITMMAATLRELVEKINTQTNNGERRAIAASLSSECRRFILREADPGQIIARIKTHKEYQALFESYIVKPINDDDRQRALGDLNIDFDDKPVHKHLKESFDNIREIISKDFEELSEPARLSSFASVLTVFREGLQCVEVTVNDEAFSYAVFQSLNAKGLRLSASDLIKNELFLVSHVSFHGAIKEAWDYIVERIPKGDIEEFLRFQHIAEKGPCRKGAVYETVKAEIIANRHDVPALLSRWKGDAERVGVLRQYLGQTNGLSLSVRETLTTLNSVFGFTYAVPLLLRAHKTWGQVEGRLFEQVVRLALNFCFRAMTVCGRDTPYIEEVITECCLRIRNGSTPSDVAVFLSAKNTDAEFLGKFAVLSESRVKVQFYVLYELEKYLAAGAGLVPLPNSPDQHIEHIMPKKLSETPARIGEWSWARANKDAHSLYLNRIGNLLIMEADINKMLSNYDFQAKQQGVYPPRAATYGGAARKSYRDSVLKLAKEVADTNVYPTWSFEQIEARQAKLGDYAVRVWSLNLAEI
jgi:hypothetical protein